MARRTERPPEVPADLSKEAARKALSVMKEQGQKLLSTRPVAEAGFDTWTTETLRYIKRSFGSHSAHITNFIGDLRMQFGNPGEAYLEAERAKRLEKRIAVLQSLIEQIDTAIAIEGSGAANASSVDPLWSLLHAKVIQAAQSRFEGGHYADAVEAALKELNTVVREMVRKKTSQELDGASLMQKAFSPNAPVIALDDLSTETGRNIQQGYMQIYAGAMTGIRNPKAHGNLTITRERAIHLLFLASLLFNKLDERP